MTALFNSWTLLTTLWLLFATYRSFNFARRLSQLREVLVPCEMRWPKISLIVPACNEGETIETAARSLLTMDYPNIEFIFVNDRSTDATGEIIAQLAKEDVRIRPIEITELPNGWLGKVHALAKGSELATGDWILITDADVHFSKTCLKKAVVFCQSNQLDFLTVLPTVHASSRLLRIFVTHFSHLLAIFVPIDSSAKKRGIAGVGAFLFLRYEIFKKSEGFEWIRLEILDDSGIAYMMRRAGAAMGMIAGQDELELEWYPSFPAFVRGLEKNVFAALHYSVVVLGISQIGSAAASGGLLIAPFFASSVWYGVTVWSALLLCLSVFAFEARRIFSIRIWEVFLTPIAFLFFPLIAIRSAVVTLSKGGVLWRTSFYPLGELRAQQRLNLLKIIKESISY